MRYDICLSEEVTMESDSYAMFFFCFFAARNRVILLSDGLGSALLTT